MHGPTPPQRSGDRYRRIAARSRIRGRGIEGRSGRARRGGGTDAAIFGQRRSGRFRELRRGFGSGGDPRRGHQQDVRHRRDDAERPHGPGLDGEESKGEGDRRRIPSRIASFRRRIHRRRSRDRFRYRRIQDVRFLGVGRRTILGMLGRRTRAPLPSIFLRRHVRISRRRSRYGRTFLRRAAEGEHTRHTRIAGRVEQHLFGISGAGPPSVQSSPPSSPGPHTAGRYGIERKAGRHRRFSPPLPLRRN
mmetsp:Transcript_8032/g.23910  ORF Transcript_8032/g.23910 Transcript_8032/m.23910 type:complete len:248 (-) Transcript_8032:785-1528(-)